MFKRGQTIYYKYNTDGRVVSGTYIRKSEEPYPKIWGVFSDSGREEWDEPKRICISPLHHIGNPCVFCGQKHGV